MSKELDSPEPKSHEELESATEGARTAQRQMMETQEIKGSRYGKLGKDLERNVAGK